MSAFAGWHTETWPRSSALQCNAAHEGSDGRSSVPVKCAAAPPHSTINGVGGLVEAQAVGENLTAHEAGGAGGSECEVETAAGRKR